MIKEARTPRHPFVIEGGGTRAGLGRPVKADRVLSTRALTGIMLPEDIVIRTSPLLARSTFLRTLDSRST